MRLVILGAGGYGRTVKDLAEQLGYSPIIILDDKDLYHPLSSYSQYIDKSTAFIPAFGNNEFRLSWCDKLEFSGAILVSLIHPTVYISPYTTIEAGTVILPHAIINTGVYINRGCIVNLGAIIDHDWVVEEGVHICIGAIVKGENRIKKCTKVEAGDIIERNTRK